MEIVCMYRPMDIKMKQQMDSLLRQMDSSLLPNLVYITLGYLWYPIITQNVQKKLSKSYVNVLMEFLTP